MKSLYVIYTIIFQLPKTSSRILSDEEEEVVDVEEEALVVESDAFVSSLLADWLINLRLLVNVQHRIIFKANIF